MVNLENTQEVPKQKLLTGKNFSPEMAQLIREWVMSCEQGIRESQINRSFIRPPLQNPNEDNTAPVHAKPIDLVPELPPTGCYENYVTALDAFFR